MTTTTIDATTLTYASIEGSNAAYATARATATDIYADNYVGQDKGGGLFYCNRGIFKYDTSVIPFVDVITRVYMKMAISSHLTWTDFDFQIVKCNWSTYDPLSSSNKDSIFDLILSSALDDHIWLNTVDIVINQYYESGVLDHTWINKGGLTYYGLRSKNDQDTAEPTQSEYVTLDLTTKVPQLVITHAPPARYYRGIGLNPLGGR